MGMSLSSEVKKSRVTDLHAADRWREHFNAFKSTDKLIVVDFHATWCPPCRSIAPKFQELAKKYKDVEFVRIDIDELTDVAREYGVEAVPTFVFIKGGKTLDKLEGADEEELKKKIEQFRGNNQSNK